MQPTLNEADIKLLKSVFSTKDDAVRLDGKISSLDKRVSTLDSKVFNLDSKVSTLDSKVSALDSKVSKMETSIGSMFLAFEKKIMAELEKDRLILAKYFEGAKIEQKFANHDARIKTIEDHLDIQPAF